MKKEKIVRFYIEADQVEKWMYQNGACYTGAFVDGVLLDNFVVDTKYGFAVFRESYVNEWSSRYYVEYAINRSGKHCEAWREVWRKWYEFADKEERRQA